MSSPLEQFRIFSLISLPKLAGYNIDFTNASLYMVLAVVAITLFFLLGMRHKTVIPNSWQILVEMSYDFIYSLLRNNVGKEGTKYIPLVFTVFLFVLTCNLLGMMPLPLKFTVTSQIIVTFTLSMVVFLSITFIGFYNQGLKFLHIFLPTGTPLWLAPMMVLIELSAYLSRPISLSIRLAANMIAGHTIIKVIAGFIVKMNVFVASVPFAFIIILIGFEIFVAVLQAYIFTVLTCVYLSDTVNKH